MSEHPSHRPPDEAPGFFDHPGRIKAIVYGVYGISFVLFFADLLYHKHAYTEFEGWFGFHAWFGFIACVGLVLAAKVMRRVLMRREDYYDDEAGSESGSGDDHAA